MDDGSASRGRRRGFDLQDGIRGVTLDRCHEQGESQTETQQTCYRRGNELGLHEDVMIPVPRDGIQLTLDAFGAL